MKILGAATALIFAIPWTATAQQTVANEDQVRRVIAYVREYREKLPSLECDEKMLSQSVKDGKVNWEVKIEAVLRELRDKGEPGGFRDVYTFKTVDGKKAKAHFSTPYFVYNVLANSLGIGEKPLPACYDYRFTTLEGGQNIQFTIDAKPGARDPSCKKIPDEYHKTMLIDVASGAVRHIERSLSPQFAELHLEIPYISIDYAPQKLGEETFWLPVRFEARDVENQGRMIATYSNFRRYIGTARILP